MPTQNLKRAVALTALAIGLYPAAAGAQVAKIELDIDGYLCGF